MKIIQVAKGDTIAKNEPDWFMRKVYENDSQCVYQNYPYVALGDNGEVYGIEGDSESKEWYAVRFLLKPSAAPDTNIYKALLNVEFANLCSPTFGKRKDLMDALESWTVTWVPYQATDFGACGSEEADMVINLGIKPSKARKSPQKERTPATHKKGTKRVGLACLLSIVGLFFPGLSLIAIPLLLSGSEALLGETAPGADQKKAPQVSPMLLVIGLASGVMGIFLPVLTFISFILIGQYYTKRCPQIYKGAKLPAG
jgi:hypothetical protein